MFVGKALPHSIFGITSTCCCEIQAPQRIGQRSAEPLGGFAVESFPGGEES
jgi:hypothetical protein